MPILVPELQFSAYVECYKVRNALVHDRNYSWPGSLIYYWDKHCELSHSEEKVIIHKQIFEALIKENLKWKELNINDFVQHLQNLFPEPKRDDHFLIYYADLSALNDEFDEQQKLKLNQADIEQQKFLFNPFARVSIFKIIENIGLYILQKLL